MAILQPQNKPYFYVSIVFYVLFVVYTSCCSFNNQFSLLEAFTDTQRIKYIYIHYLPVSSMRCELPCIVGASQGFNYVPILHIHGFTVTQVGILTAWSTDVIEPQAVSF